MKRVIPIDPMGAVRLTQRSLWTDKAKRYAAYKEVIRTAVGADYELPEAISLTFTIKMPKSWSKKKCLEMDGKPHKSKPDVDNVIKSYLDAFGVDDAHVHTVLASKRWGTSGQITAEELVDLDT